VLIRNRISANFDQIKYSKGFDMNYVIKRVNDSTSPVASVYHETSGRLLEVYSTQPGIQFYTGNQLNGNYLGKGGVYYKKHAGLCLETQHFPDSPNKPVFPTSTLKPDEVYNQQTIFKFIVR